MCLHSIQGLCLKELTCCLKSSPFSWDYDHSKWRNGMSSQMLVRKPDPDSSPATCSLWGHGQVLFLSPRFLSIEWVGWAQGFEDGGLSAPLMHHSLHTAPSRPLCWTYLLLFLKLHLGVLSVTIFPVKWESCWVACLHLLVSSWAHLPPAWSISTSLWEFLQVRALFTTLLIPPYPGVIKPSHRAVIHKIFILLDV